MSFFWVGMVLYALVLLLFLYKTKKEQARNNVSWWGSIFGFFGCFFWPATVPVFAIALQNQSKRG